MSRDLTSLLIGQFALLAVLLTGVPAWCADVACGARFSGVRAPGAPFFAILPNGEKLAPHSLSGGLHGTSITPDQLTRDGGLRGFEQTNWSLADHVVEHQSANATRDSAFRGTTSELVTVDGGGAANWAGEGGYVYDIGPAPTWNVNLALQGRIKNADGTFSGNPFGGENEHAIPRAVPLTCIKGWFKVIADDTGRILGLKTRQSYQANPAYDAARCKRYFALN